MTYKATFSKAGAFIYAAGIASFVASLVFRFPVQKVPDVVHVVILIAASYSGIGFVIYFRRAVLSSALQRTIYVLILLHLCGSAAMHLYSIVLQTNRWITVFPDWYPYLAVVYFGIFGHFCLKLKVE